MDKGYLPAARAQTCATEYGEVNFAYKKLIEPSVDAEVAKKVLDRAWMPDPNIRLFGGGRAETPPPITDAPAPSATNAPAPPATTPPAK